LDGKVQGGDVQAMVTMDLSPQDKRALSELAVYVERLAKRGGYIFVGVPDQTLRRQVERELRKLLPRRLWPKRFDLLADPTLLDQLVKRQGQVLSIGNLDALLGSGTIEPSPDSHVTATSAHEQPEILRFLNLQREIFHENHILAIFWVKPTTLANVLPWQATDLWDGRAKSFIFEGDEDLLRRPTSPGKLLQGARAQYEMAQEVLQERLSREEETVEVADLMLQLAEAARQAGLNKEAQRQAESALTIFRKHSAKEGESRVLTILAFIASDLGEPQKALQYHQEALAIDRELGYRQGEASTLGNIGLIYADLGEPQKALQYHQEALQIQRELGNTPEVARQSANLAELYLRAKDRQRAATAISEALTQQGIEQFTSLREWLLRLQNQVKQTE
jgi:tetratricopeptide (TPR) repeat protein